MAIDDVVQEENQAQASQQNEDDLEGKVKKGFWESIGEFSAWDWTKIGAGQLAGGALAGGLFGIGALNVVATTFSYVFANYLVNRKDGFTKDKLHTEFQLGAAAAPITYHVWETIGYVSNPLKFLGVLGAVMWPFTASINSSKYLIDKYTPSDFVKGIFKLEPVKDLYNITKETFTNSLKASMKAVAALAVPVLGVQYMVPQAYKVTGLVPVRTTYRYVLESHDKQQEENNVSEMPQGQDQQYQRAA